MLGGGVENGSFPNSAHLNHIISLASLFSAVPNFFSNPKKSRQNR
jgi:hypothetical protein